MTELLAKLDELYLIYYMLWVYFLRLKSLLVTVDIQEALESVNHIFLVS